MRLEAEHTQTAARPALLSSDNLWGEERPVGIDGVNLGHDGGELVEPAQLTLPAVTARHELVAPLLQRGASRAEVNLSTPKGAMTLPAGMPYSLIISFLSYQL